MDPVANLRCQRELATIIVNEHASGEPAYNEDLVIDLAELVLALDEWRKNGGFDPYVPAAKFPVEAETYYGQQFEKES